ncbi:MAG: tetratricopeptide repeat protein [Bacteroidota bacterium]
MGFLISIFFFLSPSDCTSQNQNGNYRVKRDSLLNILKKTDDTRKRMDIQILLGECYQFLRTIDSLEVLAEELAMQSKKSKYFKGQGAAYHYLGFVQQNRKKNVESLESFKTALLFYKKASDSSGMVSTNQNLAETMGYMGNLDSFFYYYKKSLRLSTKSKNFKGKGNSQVAIAAQFSKLEQHDSALYYYEKALPNLKKSNYQKGIAHLYNNVGNVYSDLEDYDSALDYYNKAVPIQTELGLIYDLAISQYNIGGIYLVMDQPKDAQNWLNKSLRVMRNLKRPLQISMVLDYLAWAATDLDKLDDALLLTREALEIKLSLNRKDLLTASYTNIAKVYQLKKQYAQAEHYLLKALEYSDFKNEKVTKSYVLMDLSKLYEETGQFDKSLVFFKKSTAIKDSTKMEAQADKLDMLKTKFRTKEKELEIIALREVELKKDIVIAQGKRKQFVLGSLILLTLLGVLFLWYRYKTKQRANLLLTRKQQEIGQKNEELLKSNMEKEILLKEIHHRVKNNLQLVMSLLNIQAREHNNKTVNTFLEKGQSRISAMALIHQTLYGSKDFSRVDMQDYLQRLTDAIYTTFGHSKEQFRFQIDTDNLQFDIQTAIPLGLIVNELVCNTLKHGFKGRKKGNLKIRLRKIRDNCFSLSFKDDGVGLDNKGDTEGKLGLELISLLAAQLEGKCDMIKPSVGAAFYIEFNEISKADQKCVS